jgi:hypothetical protein
MQQLFINMCYTTCFDPNGSPSGAANFTHSIIGLQRLCSYFHTYGLKWLLSMYIQFYQLDIDLNKEYTCGKK